MNGRVYDPVIGRFMTADPIVQAPDNLQSYNRYSYVMNSPFIYIDPSGFSAWTNFRDQVVKPVVAIVVAYYTGQWVGSQIWGSIAAMGPPTAGSVTGMKIAAGAAGGFAGGMVGSGGDLRAGAIGALTGAGFGWAGSVGGAGSIGANSLERYAAHDLAGCASGEMSGGGCGIGAFSAVAGKWVTNQTDGWNDRLAQGVATTVAGGTISVIGGGKFENGAMTAAFGYLFNRLLQAEEGQKIVDKAKEWRGTPYSLIGALSTKDGGDCSGTTWKIYGEAGFSYDYSDSRSFPNNSHFKLAPDNIPQQGDVGRWNGHVLIYDANAGRGMDSWSARRLGVPYGPANTEWWTKSKGAVKWYRYDDGK